MCACKASILTGRARRGLFETSQKLVAENLLSAVGLRPSRDVLGRIRSPQYGLFLSGLLRVANANLLPSYSPILLSLSLRAIDHAPTPNPRRFRPLWCAPTHTGASAALSHENDDDDDEVPSNAERRTSNAATHEVAPGGFRCSARAGRTPAMISRACCAFVRPLWSSASSCVVHVVSRGAVAGDGGGGAGGYTARQARCASRTPRVTRAHARVIAAHRAHRHRFRPPRARPARARYGGARSLDRSRARCGVGDGGGGGGRLHNSPCASRNCASLARTSMSSTRIARVITDFRPPRARASCGGGGARSSLDRAHAVWRRRWRWR